MESLPKKGTWILGSLGKIRSMEPDGCVRPSKGQRRPFSASLAALRSRLLRLPAMIQREGASRVVSGPTNRLISISETLTSVATRPSPGPRQLRGRRKRDVQGGPGWWGTRWKGAGRNARGAGVGLARTIERVPASLIWSAACAQT